MQDSLYLPTAVSAVARQHLQRYPHTTLRDFYKSFFQDEFGPGHLLGNLHDARQYLITELESVPAGQSTEIELCGLGKHFCRLPLALIITGQLELDAYFTAFASSAIAVTLTEINSWYARWNIIEDILRSFAHEIQNFTHDAKSLGKLFAMGEYQVSHSELYRQHYSPHYRIFSLQLARKLTAHLPWSDISVLQ